MGESAYQDLVDAGGLGAVLEAACPGCEIEMQETPGAFGSLAAMVSKDDRSVLILPRRDKRLFRLRHKQLTANLTWLTLTDLAEVTGSTAAWLGGATVREMVAARPVADSVEVADTSDRTELAWRWYRVRKPDLGEFVEAAMREPRLRRMYPFNSMYWTSFRPTVAEYWVPGPWVRSAGDGRFTVVVDRSVEPDITYDATETVQVCLAEIYRLGVPSPEEFRTGRFRSGEHP